MAVDSYTWNRDSASTLSGSSLWWRRFFIRLRSWEYWPIYIFNIPMVGFWLWNVIRSRHPFYFALTNPGIETGGFFGESKSEILKHIPDTYKPITVLYRGNKLDGDVISFFQKTNLTFPIIVKPEVGERGWLIARINNESDLK